MGNVADTYREFVSSLPKEVELVAVSKTKSVEQIMEIYNCGHRVFGESKVQELLEKYDQLPHDIQWHLIGHLQTNKVKYIAPFISMIHSVDSLKLLKVINKEARKNNRVIDCLLQLHIAEEDTKYGLSFDELVELLQSEAFKQMQHVRIRGLMCMATFTDDTGQVRREFRLLSSWFDKVKTMFFSQDKDFSQRSMGMSDDYLLAIEEGSTMIRVGSKLFGSR